MLALAAAKARRTAVIASEHAAAGQTAKGLIFAICTSTWGDVIYRVGPNRLVDPEFLGDDSRARKPLEALGIFGVGCILFPHPEKDREAARAGGAARCINGERRRPSPLQLW